MRTDGLPTWEQQGDDVMMKMMMVMVMVMVVMMTIDIESKVSGLVGLSSLTGSKEGLGPTDTCVEIGRRLHRMKFTFEDI